jgi:basic amino acid/polyamine antiporter, APA family
MSLHIGHRPALQPAHEPPDRTQAKTEAKIRALGLTSATGLVIGSVVGTGVFAMPAVLAAGGTSSLLVLAVVAIGAMLLATLFGQLTRRVPSSDGGLYAYARFEFGDFAGYLTGWCYWIQAWAGNAAIVAAWVFYVDALFGIHPSGIGNWGIALTGLWIPAVVNLAGVKGDGLVPESHCRSEIPAFAFRWCCRLVLRPQG